MACKICAYLLWNFIQNQSDINAGSLAIINGITPRTSAPFSPRSGPVRLFYGNIPFRASGHGERLKSSDGERLERHLKSKIVTYKTMLFCLSFCFAILFSQLLLSYLDSLKITLLRILLFRIMLLKSSVWIIS